MCFPFAQRFKPAVKNGRKSVLEKWTDHYVHTLWGKYFAQKILHHFQDKYVFVFYTEIQDGCQNGGKQFLAKRARLFC